MRSASNCEKSHNRARSADYKDGTVYTESKKHATRHSIIWGRWGKMPMPVFISVLYYSLILTNDHPGERVSGLEEYSRRLGARDWQGRWSYKSGEGHRGQRCPSQRGSWGLTWRKQRASGECNHQTQSTRGISASEAGCKALKRHPEPYRSRGCGSCGAFKTVCMSTSITMSWTSSRTMLCFLLLIRSPWIETALSSTLIFVNLILTLDFNEFCTTLKTETSFLLSLTVRIQHWSAAFTAVLYSKDFFSL